MSEKNDTPDNTKTSNDVDAARRTLLQVGVGAAAVVGIPRIATAKTKAKTVTKTKVATPVAMQPLPFAEDALAPVISAQTFSFHYGKHYKSYCDTTAKMIAGTPLDGKSLEEIVAASATDAAQKKLFNNAAQAWNHVFYWNSLSPKQQAPGGKLLEAIKRDFGDVASLNTKLQDAAVGQFGSGWAWLALENGKLMVTNTSNADLPLIHGQTPLLTIDVWEHAYYLDYQNKRPDHVKAVIEKTLNWEFAEANFAAA